MSVRPSAPGDFGPKRARGRPSAQEVAAAEGSAGPAAEGRPDPPPAAHGAGPQVQSHSGRVPAAPQEEGQAAVGLLPGARSLQEAADGGGPVQMDGLDSEGDLRKEMEDEDEGHADERAAGRLEEGGGRAPREEEEGASAVYAASAANMASALCGRTGQADCAASGGQIPPSEGSPVPLLAVPGQIQSRQSLCRQSRPGETPSYPDLARGPDSRDRGRVWGRVKEWRGRTRTAVSPAEEGLQEVSHASAAASQHQTATAAPPGQTATQRQSPPPQDGL